MARLSVAETVLLAVALADHMRLLQSPVRGTDERLTLGRREEVRNTVDWRVRVDSPARERAS